MTTPIEAYRTRVASGELTPDPLQEAAAQRLDTLAHELKRWSPGGWLAKKPPPQGVYLWGPVERGKSMLLDLFFETAPVKKKRRVHFHEFMLARHAFLREARAKHQSGQDQLIA